MLVRSLLFLYVSDSEYAKAVLIYYMYAATGTLFFSCWYLQSWMFAGKCNLPVDLPHFLHLFYQ